MDGNQTLKTEVVKSKPSQQSVLRIPGVPVLQQQPHISLSTAECQNYRCLTNNLRWAESDNCGFNAQRSYLQQENKTDGVACTNTYSAPLSQHKENQKGIYYHENSNFIHKGELSSQSISIHSYSDDAQQQCNTSTSTSRPRENLLGSDMSHCQQTIFANQNYQYNSFFKSRNIDKISDNHPRSEQEQRVQESNDCYKVDEFSHKNGTNFRSHNSGSWNGILKSYNPIDCFMDKHSESDSNDSDFVGSDEGQKEHYATDHLQDHKTDIMKQLDDLDDKTEISVEARFATDVTKETVVQSPVNGKEVIFHMKNDSVTLLHESAALIKDLLRCDVSLDITKLYKMEELLNAKDGITSILCTLGDEIVNKLVTWTKQLPFYQEIPVEVHSSLLTNKWHELLLLMTSAYNSLQRPRYKDLSREELAQQNMGRLKVLTYLFYCYTIHLHSSPVGTQR